MKRRAFLGFLGGAAVAGPQVAKSAAEMTLADTQLPNIGFAPGLGSGMSAMASGSDTSWAQESLKRVLGKSAAQVASERSRHHISSIEPNIAVLRSVALPQKIRISREQDFQKSRERELGYWQGVIAGWW